ncbi:zinc ribbon domain-containing protein [Clostridium cylindrosporum]|uniref:DZANK-type domain-containing protein n=1 Tax=Clostridium cylindrosporum DSM 605 TaxID=1121307 RepID=A0A0J8G728_CLOCY|nr:zinc ribbon domain-containing protein [Clostridium cylindrosporum]KMT23386.1 hypothetical protein CLCY_8c01230 [Clostridium cylindrosporum DSM 605]
MKKIDEIIQRINFKKIVCIYIVLGICAGILSLGFLVYKFREKITFLYNYNNISEKIEENNQGISSVKSDLKKLADNSSDIVDIIILNNQNDIKFSAKNSTIAKDNKLELQNISDKENRFLIIKSNPDIYFKLVNDESLILSKVLPGEEDKIKKKYEDDYFYENNFVGKKVYLLSYVTDRASGDKIYFINDIKPVANGELYIKSVAAIIILFFMIYWVLIALWVYGNATKSKLNSTLWGVLTLFTNIAGLFVYLIYKQNNKICFRCYALQGKGNVYCTCCGAKISETCKKCSTVVSLSDNFCKKCGSELEE